MTGNNRFVVLGQQEEGGPTIVLDRLTQAESEHPGPEAARGWAKEQNDGDKSPVEALEKIDNLRYAVKLAESEFPEILKRVRGPAITSTRNSSTEAFHPFLTHYEINQYVHGMQAIYQVKFLTSLRSIMADLKQQFIAGVTRPNDGDEWVGVNINVRTEYFERFLNHVLGYRAELADISALATYEAAMTDGWEDFGASVVSLGPITDRVWVSYESDAKQVALETLTYIADEFMDFVNGLEWNAEGDELKELEKASLNLRNSMVEEFGNMVDEYFRPDTEADEFAEEAAKALEEIMEALSTALGGRRPDQAQA